MNKCIALSGDLIFYKNIIDYQPSNLVHISTPMFFQRDVYLNTVNLI